MIMYKKLLLSFFFINFFGLCKGDVDICSLLEKIVRVKKQTQKQEQKVLQRFAQDFVDKIKRHVAPEDYPVFKDIGKMMKENFVLSQQEEFKKEQQEFSQACEIELNKQRVDYYEQNPQGYFFCGDEERVKNEVRCDFPLIQQYQEVKGQLQALSLKKVITYYDSPELSKWMHYISIYKNDDDCSVCDTWANEELLPKYDFAQKCLAQRFDVDFEKSTQFSSVKGKRGYYAYPVQIFVAVLLDCLEVNNLKNFFDSFISPDMLKVFTQEEKKWFIDYLRTLYQLGLLSMDEEYKEQREVFNIEFANNEIRNEVASKKGFMSKTQDGTLCRVENERFEQVLNEHLCEKFLQVSKYEELVKKRKKLEGFNGHFNDTQELTHFFSLIQELSGLYLELAQQVFDDIIEQL